MRATLDQARGHYLPGMGHSWLTPLYDPLQWLLRIPSIHERLVGQAEVRPGQRVLEIGCGTGNVVTRVKRRQPGATVVGVDPDRRALARARRKAARHALDVQLDHGFAEHLPYGDASFDTVLSAFMFHHLGPDERIRALREVRRVLGPGGSVHLVDFGGAAQPTDGFIARRAHRSHRLRDNFGGRIPALMREAGLAAPVEVAHTVNRVLGRVTHYRASAPPADVAGRGATDAARGTSR